MIYEQKSAAKAVKARKDRARVHYDEATTKAVTRAASRTVAIAAEKRPAGQVTGGKSCKTGMVLARAKLPRATSGIAATRDRQNALLGKGEHRDAEKVASEAPVGTMTSASRPKRKDSEHGSKGHKEAFYTWMKKALHGKVRSYTRLFVWRCETWPRCEFEVLNSVR